MGFTHGLKQILYKLSDFNFFNDDRISLQRTGLISRECWSVSSVISLNTFSLHACHVCHYQQNHGIVKNLCIYYRDVFCYSWLVEDIRKLLIN
jgi:hypothetical protein